MRFSPDDVVFRIALNLEGVRTADAALRAWLPLVSLLRPVAVEFEAADPAGLRRGFLASLLVAVPATRAGTADDGADPDRLHSAVRKLSRQLGLDPADFVVDEDGNGGVTDVKDASHGDGGSSYGVYLVFALVGADPLRPERDEADYEDTDEDL